MRIKVSGRATDRSVKINGVRIREDVSQRIRNHSPDGFNWGYGGSGPAQLALAICVELYGEEVAVAMYQKFKFAVIGRLPIDEDFEITFERNDDIETIAKKVSEQLNA